MSSYGAISKWPSGKWLPRSQKWMKKNSDKFHSPSDMLFRRFGGFRDPGDPFSQWKIDSPKFFHAQGGRHSWLWFSQSSRLDYLFWNLSHWNPTRTYSVKLPKAYFKKWGGGGGGRREGAVRAAVPVGPGRSSRMQLHLHHSWLHEQSELLWTLEGSERCVEKKSVLFIESQLSDDDPVTNISWGLSIHA